MVPPTLKEVFQDPQLVSEAINNPNHFKFPVAPKLIVASDEYPPHVFVTVHPNGSFTQHGGLIDLFNMMAQSVNFTYELVRPPDGKWGQLSENGTWSGMVGMVVRKEVDMALGPFASTYNRAKWLSLTPAIVVDPLVVAVGRQSPETNPWNFALTFTTHTWISLLAALILATIVVLLLGLTEARNRSNTCAKMLIQCFDIFFELSKGVLQLDMLTYSQRLPLRLVVCFWLLFVFVVMRTFSGALVALLAVRTTPVLFRNLDDVIANDEIKLIIEAGSVVTEMFHTEKNGYVGRVGEKYYSSNRIVELSLLDYYEAMVNNVAGKKDMLLVGEHLLLETYINRNFDELGYCTVYIIPEFFIEYRIAMALAKHTPLLNPFKARILRYQSMGLYDHWIDKELVNASHCSSLPGKVSYTEPYGINSIGGMLYLLGGGLALATLTFLCELLVPNIEDLRPAKWKGLDVLSEYE